MINEFLTAIFVVSKTTLWLVRENRTSGGATGRVSSSMSAIDRASLV
jgi:hypothetical protein